MRKNKILLAFSISFALLFIASLFITINNIQLRQYWFSIACVFIGQYSLLYCFMYKLDSSLYYGILVSGIGATSFYQSSFIMTFYSFYPVYLLCFALASFAVFARFRQKIHFKLFAIFAFEGILLIVYKLNYLNYLQVLIINGAYLLFVIINAIIRVKRNLKEN